MQHWKRKRLAQWGLPGILAIALTSMLFVALDWAASRADDIAADRQRDLVTLIVSKLKASVAHDQESATVWDDAVINTRAQNRDWLSANLGVWMHSYFGHDVAVVLDGSNRPLYQFSAAADTTEESRALASAYLPLATRLRARLAAADRTGTGDRILSIGEADIEKVANRPAIVSVKPIVSDTGNIRQVAGSEALHVAVRYLDDGLPRSIGMEYHFDDLRFNASLPEADDLSSVPLQSASGSIVGYFQWHPFKPGRQVLRSTIPALLALMALIFAAASLAASALRRRSIRLTATQLELHYRATHDALTGLANRAYFSAQLAERTQGLKAYSVLYVDLDRFKEVNDNFGHPVGDRLIAQVAARMRDLLPDALVARVGGDEFTVLLEGDRHRAADEIADELVKRLRVSYEIGDALVTVGASIGVAMAIGETDPVEVTRRADIALYHAKAAGRNTYAIFGNHMDELLRTRRTIEADLRAALEAREQIEVVYQPVFDAEGNGPVSLEALARWNHPSAGYIPPSIFIPVAEEIGLVQDLGAVVIEDACRLMADLPAMNVAINASAKELESPSYALRVLSTLARFGVKPARLEIEMTESVAIGDGGNLDKAVSMLRSAGVRFAIDDFGTGYSTFARMQKYQIDRVKIDKSFVDDMSRSDSRALVVAMINMAQARGLQVTAEGVETAEQQDLLRSLGCDHLQGYHFSHPLSGADVRDLIAGALRRTGSDA